MAVMDYINELKNQRDLLADIISEKGVTASRSEKFNTLIPKINDISTGGGMGGVIQFSDHNMLLDVDFFNSSYAACVKGDKFVNVTFVKLTSSMGPWFSLTGKIPFNTKKYYKISVNNSWTGYGRLGINKRYTSSFSTNTSSSPFGSGGSNCGLNAIGDFWKGNPYNDEDNHVMQRGCAEDKIFRIIPNAYNSLTVNGSLWVSRDNDFKATLKRPPKVGQKILFEIKPIDK